MIAPTLLAALLLAGEVEQFAAIREFVTAAHPEPEPPPGLRAPKDSQRYRKAREKYDADLARWQKTERARRMSVVLACTDYLQKFPDGPRVPEVRYFRGVAHFQDGDYRLARPDLRAFLATRPRGPAAAAALKALVEACRAMGDYDAAARHAGPAASPDLLEEAGRTGEAIKAAERAGLTERAAAWRLIGTRLEIAVPAGARAAIVEAGPRLAAERREALRRAFDKKKLAFVVAGLPRPAIYLIDADGVIRAIDPRPDTWTHRVTRIVDAK